MTQPTLFEWAGLCHCWWVIKEQGRACAVCRIESMLDCNYIENAMEMYSNSQSEEYDIPEVDEYED